jgi:hypothetical protein
MKTLITVQTRTPRLSARTNTLRIISGFLPVILLAGCATEKPRAFVQAGAPSTLAPVQVNLGPIGLICPAQPAEFRFDKAEGRIESAADRAGEATGSFLETPTAGFDPAVEMAAGAIRFDSSGECLF